MPAPGMAYDGVGGVGLVKAVGGGILPSVDVRDSRWVNLDSSERELEQRAAQRTTTDLRKYTMRGSEIEEAEQVLLATGGHREQPVGQTTPIGTSSMAEPGKAGVRVSTMTRLGGRNGTGGATMTRLGGRGGAGSATMTGLIDGGASGAMCEQLRQCRARVRQVRSQQQHSVGPSHSGARLQRSDTSCHCRCRPRQGRILLHCCHVFTQVGRNN